MAETLGIQLPWTAAGVWLMALSLLGLLIRQIGPWRKQTAEVETRLRDDLIRRLEKIERTLDTERAIHKAERSLDRHRLNNITGCFDALLMLIKANPSKAAESVVMIEDMRAKQLVAEAEEKALIRAAEIAAAKREAEIEAGATP